MRHRSDRRGIVLAIVLVFVLLLVTAVFTFQRRAIVDRFIIVNRDAAAQAEALARGGVRLGIALLLQDLVDEVYGADGGGEGDERDDRRRDDPEESRITPGDTHDDLWALIGDYPIETADGGVLRLRIQDAGSRVNLNGLVDYSASEDAEPDADSEEFLVDFLSKVIDEIPLAPGDKFWDPRELARNLLDYLDADDNSRVGGGEDDFYASQNPPYAAANRPMLSVDELRLVEGFDRILVEALRPYVTVYPLVGGGSGVNLNTAAPHILAAAWHGSPGSRRLLNEDRVREILRMREEGRIFCDDSGIDPRCVTPADVDIEGSLYPASVHPAASNVFRIAATARVNDVQRTAVAVIDRSDPVAPLWLSYGIE